MIHESASSAVASFHQIAPILLLLGTLIWLATLPGTRQLATSRLSAVKQLFKTSATPGSEKPPPDAATDSYPLPGSKKLERREDSPEIRNFDTSIFDRFKTGETTQP